MRAPGLRLYLGLVAAAVAAATVAPVLAFGLPVVVRHHLAPAPFVALAVAGAVAGAALGAVLLARVVARPIERLFAAAAALGPGGLPLLGEGGLGLPRAALAFERLAAELEAERARLAAKVAELTSANAAVAEARESLLRTEKLATVGRLAAGLAHEVGNPLGAISGYAEVARARVPAGASPELADALERIASAAARIDRTVRDLLDFARPTPAQVAPIDLLAALDASLRLARVQSRFKHVNVELAVPAGLPRVLADEHHLAQVLLNLLLNAGDAMRGAGRVRLEARAVGTGVELAVADEGPGIPADDLPRVFDPFFTTKEPGEGTGLGLAISHRIMESFGGEIAARNRPGGGAEFTLRFRGTA